MILAWASPFKLHKYGQDIQIIPAPLIIAGKLQFIVILNWLFSHEE